MMSNQNPYFVVVSKKNLVLENLNYDSRVFHAIADLQFVTGDPPEVSPFCPFRLDTGTEVSTIPAEWLEGKHNLARYFASLSKPIPLDTSAGPNTGKGQIAAAVRVRWAGHPQEYKWDFLVSSTLKKKYGLISLRDVLRDFHISSAEVLLPTMIGRIDLYPV
jgi:hypothetical protein